MNHNWNSFIKCTLQVYIKINEIQDEVFGKEIEREKRREEKRTGLALDQGNKRLNYLTTKTTITITAAMMTRMRSKMQSLLRYLPCC